MSEAAEKSIHDDFQEFLSKHKIDVSSLKGTPEEKVLDPQMERAKNILKAVLPFSNKLIENGCLSNYSLGQLQKSM